jgi:hypothetical protein
VLFFVALVPDALEFIEVVLDQAIKGIAVKLSMPPAALCRHRDP